MIVYEATKKSFIEDVRSGKIADIIEKKCIEKMNYYAKQNEKNSWKNSLPFMKDVLMDSEISANVGIAIEYVIKGPKKGRIDFIITGKDENQKNNVIIIELKRWKEVKLVKEKDDMVRTWLGGKETETRHPSYQVWSYAISMEESSENIKANLIGVYPCAYLHNYRMIIPPTLLAEHYKKYLEKAPIFIKGDEFKLRKFIKKYIKHGDDKETLYLIEKSKIIPPKSLQDALKSMYEGNDEFILIDDQKDVYEQAKYMAKKSFEDGKKRVLVVKGGPGTGKSVLAI